MILHKMLVNLIGNIWFCITDQIFERLNGLSLLSSLNALEYSWIDAFFSVYAVLDTLDVDTYVCSEY